MRIEIRTRGVDLSDSLRAHIERCLNFGLDWARHDIARVAISLSDINGPRGGTDKRCQIRIPLPRARGVQIEEVAGDLQIATARAVDRAARTLARRLTRQREFGPLPQSVMGEAR